MMKQIVLWIIQFSALANGYDYKQDTFNPAYTAYVHVFGILFSAGLCRLALRTFRIPIPQGVLFLTIGVLCGIGILLLGDSFGKYALSVIPKGSLYGLYFTVLIVRISFCIDINAFFKSFVQIVIVSGPVSLFTAVVCGCVMRLVVNTSWDYSKALLLGLLCVPILPIEIIQQLEELGASTRHTIVLLEGETIVGLVFFLVFFNITDAYFMGNIAHWYQIVSVTIRFILFGVVVGFPLGYLGAFLLQRMSSDPIRIILLVFSLSYMAYYISAIPFGSGGVVAVIIVGMMMGKDRSLLASEIDEMLLDVAEIMFQAFNAIIHMRAGAYTVVYGFSNSEVIATELIYGLILYLVLYVSRFFNYLIFSPILRRLGYGLPLNSMLICAWGGLKSPIVSYYVIVHGELTEHIQNAFTSTFLPIIFVVLYLSLLINGTMNCFIMKLMGLYEISTVKKINMNNCMRNVLERRETTIAIMKTDRYLADSNWPVVFTGTQLTHPYKIDVTDMEEDDDYVMGYRFTTCPDCKKDILNEPTKQELTEMKREARLRVLKAKAISYSRQYEQGMISKEGIRILKQAVEMAMDNPEAVIEFEGVIKVLEQKGIMFITEYQQITQASGPHKNRRRTSCTKMSFNIVNSVYFELLVHFVITLNVVTAALELAYYLKAQRKDYLYLTSALNSIFCTFYVVEFVLKISACLYVYVFVDGIRAYFRTKWHFVEFIIMIFSIIDLILLYIYVIVGSFSPMHDFLIALRFIRAVRLLVLFRHLRICFPRLGSYFETKMDSDMAFAYEIGKTYITALEDILEILPFIIDHDDIRNEIKVSLRNHRLVVTKLLAIVQKDKPWIAITVKTVQAIRSVLNSMRSTINELKMSGWVEDGEHAKLMDSLAQKYKYVTFSLKFVQPNSPEMLFKEVFWLGGETEIINMLFQNAVFEEFPPGRVICSEGQVSKGIYILVTGLLMMSYNPNQEVLDKLTTKGCLPIVEFLTGLKLSEPFDDYIVPGNCIGELCTLTGRPYNCTITADTTCQAYLLKRSFIQRAMKMSQDPQHGLESRIWSSLGTRLAIPILVENVVFQNTSTEEIKYSLERAFSPDVSDLAVFEVTESIQDLVLIEGVVGDVIKEEVFIGPCYIPRTSTKLFLIQNNDQDVDKEIRPRLLVIPEVGTQDINMTKSDKFPSGNTSSFRCLQHLIQRRIEARKRGSVVVNIPDKDNNETQSSDKEDSNKNLKKKKKKKRKRKKKEKKEEE